MVWDRSVLEKLSAGELVKICQNKSKDVSECRRFEISPNSGWKICKSWVANFIFLSTLLSEKESIVKQIKTVTNNLITLLGRKIILKGTVSRDFCFRFFS